MPLNITQEIARLQRMGPKELRVRYAEVFGESTHARNKAWLVRRIAWRLQALAEGGLSERAQKRAEELARDAELRLTPPRTKADEATPQPLPAPACSGRDLRLPPPGSLLVRKYRGQTLQVRVLVDGFEFDGQRYSSLSAVARAITGSHCNGFLFFKLAGHGGDQ